MNAIKRITAAHMTSGRVRAVLTAVAAFASSHASAGQIFGIYAQELIKIDSETLTVSAVGPTGVAAGEFGDLAYRASTNTMYWVPGSGNNNLYTVNLISGNASLVGSHGVDDLSALAWDEGNGALVAQSAAGICYELDGATGTATFRGNNAVEARGYDYSGGNLIGLESGTGYFYTISSANGSATILSMGDGAVGDNDLAYDSETNSFWVLDDTGSLFRYDASTFGRSSALSGLGVITAAEYVPSPGSAAVVVAWAILASARQRRSPL